MLLEAMAAGKPVVASRYPAMPSVVTHNEDGLLVAPKDSMSLALAIVRLFSDSDLQQLSVEGRRTAETYAWPGRGTRARGLPAVLPFFNATVTGAVRARPGND